MIAEHGGQAVQRRCGSARSPTSAKICCARESDCSAGPELSLIVVAAPFEEPGARDKETGTAAIGALDSLPNRRHLVRKIAQGGSRPGTPRDQCVGPRSAAPAAAAAPSTVPSASFGCPPAVCTAARRSPYSTLSEKNPHKVRYTSIAFGHFRCVSYKRPSMFSRSSRVRPLDESNAFCGGLGGVSVIAQRRPGGRECHLDHRVLGFSCPGFLKKVARRYRIEQPEPRHALRVEFRGFKGLRERGTRAARGFDALSRNPSLRAKLTADVS